MILSNRFSDEDKASVWIFEHACLNCNSNQGLALHHIFGAKGAYNNSICNSIMLCNLCHLEADSQNTHQTGNPLRIKYLGMALRQIMKVGYCFTDNDSKFLASVQADVDVILCK